MAESVSNFENSAKGYDSPLEFPGHTCAVPIVVTGDLQELDTYFRNKGLERVMPITKDGVLGPSWAVRPKPDCTTMLATLLRDVAQKEDDRLAEKGTYVRLIQAIILNAITPRQTDT